MYIKGNLKKYKKDGEEYFKVNKIDTKITVGDGSIKLTSKDAAHQFEGKNTFNQNMFDHLKESVFLKHFFTNIESLNYLVYNVKKHEPITTKKRSN